MPSWNFCSAVRGMTLIGILFMLGGPSVLSVQKKKGLFNLKREILGDSTVHPNFASSAQGWSNRVSAVH